MKNKFRNVSVILIILLQVLSHPSRGQQLSLEWHNRYGLENWDYANDLIQLANGSYMIVGCLRAELNADSLQSSASNNGWIASVDSTGLAQWQKTFKGKEFETVTSVTENGQSIIISGLFQDTVILDSVSLISDTYMSGFYAFLDSEGNMVKLEKIGEDGVFKNVLLSTNNLSKTFIVCAFSNKLVLPTLSYAENYNAIFWSELDLSGSILDPFVMKCSGKINLKSVQSTDSIVYIAGSFSDTLFIGDSSFISSGNIDAFLASFSVGGALNWVRTISGSGNQQISDIAVGLDGKVGITGYFENEAFIDNQVLYSYGSKDMIVALLDNQGHIQWLKNIGSISNDMGYSINMNLENDVFVSGSFVHIIAIPDENGNMVQLESFSPFGNSFIAKYNESGVLKASYSLPGTSEDYCQSIEIAASGRITAIGNFYQKIKLQIPEGEIIEIVSKGDKDVFMLHFDDMCKDFQIDAGNDTIICPNQSLSLIPTDEYTSFIWEPGGDADEYLEVSQPGTFCLTATNLYGCIAKDSLQVFQGNLPQVFAGADTIIEPGQQLEILHSSGSDSTFWNWTTSGDGYFENPQALHTYYSPSNTDISEGSTILSLAGINICGTIADSLIVTIPIDDDGVTAYPNPTSDIVTLVCEEGQTIQSVTVTNQTGYVFVYGQTVNNYYYSFDFSPYPPGTFLFYITTNNEIVTKIVNKI